MSTLDALQTTLAAEHAALWLYGVYGGRTSASAQPRLYAAVQAGYDLHRAQRDVLVRAVLDLGGQPVAAAAAYDLPDPLVSAIAVQGAALGVEQRCATTYAALVAQSVGDQRRWAVEALTGAAVRSLGLGGVPESLPGLGGSG